MHPLPGPGNHVPQTVPAVYAAENVACEHLKRRQMGDLKFQESSQKKLVAKRYLLGQSLSLSPNGSEKRDEDHLD